MINTIGISAYWKSAYHFVCLLLLCGLGMSSCKHSDNFNNREYTKGVYKDFNLHREKTDKELHVDSSDVNERRLNFPDKVEVPELPKLLDIQFVSSPEKANEVFHEQHPAIAERVDGVIAKQMGKDSSWMHDDSMPECVTSAFSTQAMLGAGVVSGLITMAAPNFIWVSFIFMIAAPLMLLISLISAAIAMAKINSGEIDAKYKRAMRVWAICMIANILLGSLILLHFTA